MGITLYLFPYLLQLLRAPTGTCPYRYLQCGCCVPVMPSTSFTISVCTKDWQTRQHAYNGMLFYTMATVHVVHRQLDPTKIKSKESPISCGSCEIGGSCKRKLRTGKSNDAECGCHLAKWKHLDPKRTTPPT